MRVGSCSWSTCNNTSVPHPARGARMEEQGWMRRRSTFTSTRSLLTALPTGGSPPAPKSALN
eukprot:4093315-Prymnesium_polylepis.1